MQVRSDERALGWRTEAPRARPLDVSVRFALDQEMALGPLEHGTRRDIAERHKRGVGFRAEERLDADKVAPGETYMRNDLPANGLRLYADAEGVDHVVVNGQEIIRHGKYLGVPAGIVLRPGRDTYTVTIPGSQGATAAAL